MVDIIWNQTPRTNNNKKDATFPTYTAETTLSVVGELQSDQHTRGKMYSRGVEKSRRERIVYIIQPQQQGLLVQLYYALVYGAAV